MLKVESTLKKKLMLPDYIDIILRTKNSPFLITNAEGVIYGSNSAFSKLTGYKKKEILNTNLIELSVRTKKEKRDTLSLFSSSSNWLAGAFSLKKASGEVMHFPCKGMLLNKEKEIQKRIIGIQFEKPVEFNILSRQIQDLNKEIWNRKKIQQQLLNSNENLIESEMRWKYLLVSIQAAVIIHAPDTAILMSNQEACLILGLTEDQMQGKTAMDTEWRFVKPDGADMDFKDYPANKIVTSGEPIRNYLVGVRRKDRSYITWVIVNGTPLFQDTGEIREILITFMEITDLRQKERSLRFTEFAVEHSGEAMFWVSEDAKLVRVNKRAHESLGYERAELLTKTVYDIDPEFQANIWKGFWKQMTEVNYMQKESTHRKKNGDLFPVELMLSTFPYENKVYVLATVRDISKRKTAEKELSSIKNYLQNLFNSMPSVLIGIDAEGKIVQSNKAAEHFCKKTISEIQGKRLDKALPLLAEHIDKILTSISSHQVLNLDKVEFTEKSATNYFNITVFPLTQHQITGAVIRLDKVTEKIRMERMMIQTEKMLSVGGLAAGMAHELNNPIAGILMGVQNIQRRLSPDLLSNTKKGKEDDIDLARILAFLEERGIPQFLEGIRDAGKRSAAIVKNMLYFSRKPEGVMAAEDINTIIQQSLELAQVDYDLKKQYDFRNIEISLEMKNDIPKVRCIASEIQQVLLNLLRNAAQALFSVQNSHKKSAITIRTYHKKDTVHIEVENNGPEIAPEIKRHIFEPFYTTRPVGEGTGLGLSVSYFIIHEEHNGTITVDSTPGKNTVFHITLLIEGYMGK